MTEMPLERAWRNPFDGDAARAHSSYHAVCGDGVVRLLETAPASPFVRVANDAFRAFVLDDALLVPGREGVHPPQTPTASVRTRAWTIPT